MEVRIEILSRKIFLGKSIRMSLINNTTYQLWNSFMLARNTIKNKKGNNLYSIQVYDDLHYFEKFNPNTEFTKWAAIEVENSNNIPNGFSKLTLHEGLYAVFIHKGAASEFSKTFQYILGKWLPQSDYALDNRPHFELLGEKYKNNDPNSEEEVWIPIRKKV